jgi:16S rRNA (cytosine967-C5)-methyltransferase
MGSQTLSKNPRAVAAKVIQGVVAGQSLSELIPRFLTILTDSRDGGLLREFSYGVLRSYPKLHRLAQKLMKRPLKARDRDVEALILIGLYQLLALRVADYAAVHATAGAAKTLGKPWAVGLINGVLRSFQRQREQLLETLADDPQAYYAMPNWLLKRIQQQWPNHWEEPVAALNSRPPMSLRVNRSVNKRSDYQQRLASEGITASPIPHTCSGLTLDKPMDVSKLPGFYDGCVSVQDGAAQLAAELFDLHPGQRVLDACAAPGGKCCHLLEREPKLALTAVDCVPERLDRVIENFNRLKLQGEVLMGDASRPQGDWADRSYDHILLDVPCSATGVMRRHPDIKLLRRARDIPNLVAQQRTILEAIWPRLAKGGTLIYVTCSILAQENEQQLQDFLSKQSDAQEQPLEVTWGEKRVVGRQIAPGMAGMDGFFYACLVKHRL